MLQSSDVYLFDVLFVFQTVKERPHNLSCDIVILQQTMQMMLWWFDLATCSFVCGIDGIKRSSRTKLCREDAFFAIIPSCIQHSVALLKRAMNARCL